MEYYVIMVTKVERDTIGLHSSNTYHIPYYVYHEIKKLIKTYGVKDHIDIKSEGDPK